MHPHMELLKRNLCKIGLNQLTDHRGRVYAVSNPLNVHEVLALVEETNKTNFRVLKKGYLKQMINK